MARKKTPMPAKRASADAKRASRDAIRAFRAGKLMDEDGNAVTDENTAAAIAMRRGMTKMKLPMGSSSGDRSKRAKMLDGLTF